MNGSQITLNSTLDSRVTFNENNNNEITIHEKINRPITLPVVGDPKAFDEGIFPLE